MLSSPVGGGGAVGRLFAKLLRPTRARDGGGDPGADAPTHLSRARPMAGRTMVSLMTGGAILDGPERPEVSTHLYPEWDERRQTYRPDWCHVHEDVADAGSGSSVDLPDRVALTPGARAARHRADAVPPAAPGWGYRHRRDRAGARRPPGRWAPRRGRLHRQPPAVPRPRRPRAPRRVRIRRRAGGGGPHCARAPAATPPSRSPPRSTSSAIASRCMPSTRVAVPAVHLTRVKGFDDHLDVDVTRRLDGLEPAAFTRLGAAIRHGSALLEPAAAPLGACSSCCLTASRTTTATRALRRGRRPTGAPRGPTSGRRVPVPQRRRRRRPRRAPARLRFRGPRDCAHQRRTCRR